MDAYYPEILKFLVSVVLSGGLATVLTVFVPFFGKKWIENRFSKNFEAFKVQKLHEFDVLLTRKVKWHDREHEVLSECWVKLVQAHAKLKTAIYAYQNVPNFSAMSSDELKQCLKRNSFTEDETIFFDNETDKVYAFAKVMSFRATNTAYEAFFNFHTYFENNKIFLQPEIKEKFCKVDNYIWQAWVSQEMSLRSSHALHSNTDHAFKAFETENEKITPLIKDIEDTIQTVLFPS